MKVIARIEVKPGMMTADDILTYKNELIVSKNTKLTPTIIAKLARHSIMVVPIKDEMDFATTHFEKVRLTEGFKNFEATYTKLFPVYKTIVMRAVTNNEPINMDQLMQVYNNLTVCARTGETLLDYLYNMLPGPDDLTHAHMLNSALIAGVFGTWLALPTSDITFLIHCAFVYDIGKLMIPYQILWKPDRLTSDEYRLVQQHTTLGYEFLKRNFVTSEHMLNATLMHHERCDGTGYPHGLKSHEMDKYSKYIAIIDTYEAMTSPRSYRTKLNPFQIIGNYENEGFQRYDAESLRTILSHIANSQLGLNVQLNDGSQGEIMLINEKSLSRPLIKLNDKNSTLINMADRPDLFIVSVY